MRVGAFEWICERLFHATWKGKRKSQGDDKLSFQCNLRNVGMNLESVYCSVQLDRAVTGISELDSGGY